MHGSILPSTCSQEFVTIYEDFLEVLKDFTFSRVLPCLESFNHKKYNMNTTTIITTTALTNSIRRKGLITKQLVVATNSGISKRARALEETIWSTYTPLAVANNAVNLGQGFPDWKVDGKLKPYHVRSSYK